MEKWLNMFKHISPEEIQLFIYKYEPIRGLNAYKWAWEDGLNIKPPEERAKLVREMLAKAISLKRYWLKQGGEEAWEDFLTYTKNGGERDLEKLYDRILKERFFKKVEKLGGDYPFIEKNGKKYIIKLDWDFHKQKWKGILIDLEKEKILLESYNLAEFFKKLQEVFKENAKHQMGNSNRTRK